VPGPGGTFQTLVIYHHVLSLCSRSERERRIRLYEKMRPGEGGGHYYLYEKYCPSEAPIPESKAVNFDQEVVRMDRLPRERISAISLKVKAAPREVIVSEMFWLDVELMNATSEALYSCPPFPVHFAYHWIKKPTRRMIVFEGERSGFFPCAPANATKPWRMAVMAPNEPGEYALQLTVVQDGVRWLDDVNPGILQEFDIRVSLSAAFAVSTGEDQARA
jgi:hypothetical protein